MSTLQRRVPFPPATSHRIDLVAPGWLCKRLGASSLIGDARWARPPFVIDPGREPAVYRSLLAPLRLGPRALAWGDDWVVVERTPGVELWQVDDLAVLGSVARALADVHRRLAGGDLRGVPLLVHDEELAGAFRRRAAAAGAPAAVLAAHTRATERLLAAETTVIHGDAYPSNVIVGPDVVFIDWEMAGLGPAVLDVAALTAGAWPPVAVDAMTRAYFEAAATGQDWAAWSDDLRAARLYVCVQWIGWAPGWRPPVAHAHDWLAEAAALAECL